MLERFHAGNVYTRLPASVYRALHRKKECFACPLCLYEGPFVDLRTSRDIRLHVICPRCGARERHRLQYLVMRTLQRYYPFHAQYILHIAPERFFAQLFAVMFAGYTSVDLSSRRAQVRADITCIPFDSGSFDVVFASHVLEHITNDERAIDEVARVLKPDGLAILPVPIVAETTVEYPEPDWDEHGHVRAPGLDYYEKYKKRFPNVTLLSSRGFDDKYQTNLFTTWRRRPPHKAAIQRPRPDGQCAGAVRYRDYVPVCSRMPLRGPNVWPELHESTAPVGRAVS